MLGKRKWGLAGLAAGIGLCTMGWIGCATGGGGGTPTDGPIPPGGALDVSFSGAAGGNSAVAQDDDGNEYTFRQNDAGQVTEANIRMADTGQVVKVSLDANGRPVKVRASDNTNADLVYEADGARIRYTPASGQTQEATGINFKSARARIQRRRALQESKRQTAMQASEGVNRLRTGLQTYDEVVESIFDEEENPDTPLRKTALEEPVKRIARVVDDFQVREVDRDKIANVELDRVPPEIEALAGKTFALFEAEGYCIEGTQRAGDAGERLRKSVLTFDSNGNLLTEIDRKFLFDLGLGGGDPEITINWEANTMIDLTQLVDPALLADLDFTATVTPVFTGTQVDDDRQITVERRFLAEITYLVELFTTTEARTEQLFNAAFINGVLTDNILEFDLVLIDLANETEPRPLARLRYYNQNTLRPTERLFRSCDQPTGPGTGLDCPASATPYQWFTVEFTDRGAAADPDRVRRLEYEWYVSSGYGYVENPYDSVATVVPTDEGLLEVSLIISDPLDPEQFDLYMCEVRVGEITAEGAQGLDCPISMNVGQADYFYLAGGDAMAAGPRQATGDAGQVTGGDGGSSVEWFVFGTSDFLVDEPFSPETYITFNGPGRFEVWLVVYQPDGTEAYASCEVSVDAAGFDECAEFGWYEDGLCDDFCPLPDPDCRSEEVSDWCQDAGFYGDGVCDPDCPQPDSDCDQFDWCDELGWYGDGFCDPDCPHPDPDCATIDVCQENGWYGDGICDDFCPLFDPDCQLAPDVQDICEDLGYYNDGFCDEFCPRPDPDCGDFGVGVTQCVSDADCGLGEICFNGECLFAGGGGA